MLGLLHKAYVCRKLPDVCRMYILDLILDLCIAEQTKTDDVRIFQITLKIEDAHISYIVTDLRRYVVKFIITKG